MDDVGPPACGAQCDRGGAEVNEPAKVARVPRIDDVARALAELEQEDARAPAAPSRVLGELIRLDLGEQERPAAALDRVLWPTGCGDVRVARQQHTNLVAAFAQRIAQPRYGIGQSAGFRPRGELRADHEAFHRATCAAPS